MHNTVISIVLRSVLSAVLSCVLQPQAAAAVVMATGVTLAIVRSCNSVGHDRCVAPNAVPARGKGLE